MLYTTSAVQILATIDALSELEGRARGGAEEVASCEWTNSPFIPDRLEQALLIIL